MDRFHDRRGAFVELHQAGCFVIPNPWDVGSARYLRHLGFRALATTSAGFLFTRGRPDAVSGMSCDDALTHIAEIVEATGLPVNADFQAGYALNPDGVAVNVARCVRTGVAGLSIEDATGDSDRPLYDLSTAVRRIEAARAAIDDAGAPVLLTARAESYLVGQAAPLEDVLRRLTAYAAAGADVLFSPGVKTREDIREIVRAVAPKPVNVLYRAGMGLTVADFAELGVRRISAGSGLARAAWAGFIHAARAITERGSFEGMDSATAFADLNRIFEDG